MTADIGVWFPAKPRRRSRRPALLGIPLAVMIGVAVIIPSSPSQTPSPSSLETIGVVEEVVRVCNGTSTIWRFTNWSWLYEIEVEFSFCFEVHGCSGESGRVIYGEHEGNRSWREDFDYEGVADIYLVYRHLETYNRTGALMTDEWSWFGNVTKDWREGSWTPSHGIEFIHAENQTFGDAVLVALYFVPIPEFGLSLVIGITMVLFVIWRRKR